MADDKGDKPIPIRTQADVLKVLTGVDRGDGRTGETTKK